jgi:hypothetical protein
MKTIISMLLCLIVSHSSATGYDPVLISGSATQIALISNSTVSNTVNGSSSVGQQNLASNTGGVVISGNSLQMVSSSGSVVKNEVFGSDSLASQNFSSNIGEVGISGRSIQITAMRGAYVYNSAQGHETYAIQNVASNNACFSCPSGNCGSGSSSSFSLGSRR